MKGLPEHIKDVDGFYKAKSEDDFMPELPENLWDEIVLHIPSSPLPAPTTPSVEKGGGGLKGINFYHGATFYAAGLLSAILVYTAYLHFTHQEDTASIQVTLPSFEQTKSLDSASTVLYAAEEDTRSKKSFSNSQSSQEEIQFSSASLVLSKKDGKLTNAKEDNPKAVELPTEAGHPQTNQVTEQNEKPESTEEKATAPTAVQEEQTDFYHKHSKKAKDSLSKQLFIPKK